MFAEGGAEATLNLEAAWEVSRGGTVVVDGEEGQGEWKIFKAERTRVWNQGNAHLMQFCVAGAESREPGGKRVEARDVSGSRS